MNQFDDKLLYEMYELLKIAYGCLIILNFNKYIRFKIFGNMPPYNEATAVGQYRR